MNSLFISECLEGVNAPLCHVCSSKQDADSRFYICEVGNYLIVQLKRFLVIDGVVVAVPVICTPYLDVLVHVEDEVSCVRKFVLVSGIPWCLVYVIRAPYTLVITLPLLEMMCVVVGCT